MRYVAAAHLVELLEVSIEGKEKESEEERDEQE